MEYWNVMNSRSVKKKWNTAVCCG